MAYCGRCERNFQYWSSYQQHLANSSFHNICDVCDDDFVTWEALRQHYIQSYGHHFCRACDTLFEDDFELERHCNDEHYYCPTCDKFFKNAYGLREHNRQAHNLCDECGRVFISRNSLREHSIVHRPRDVPCAFQYRGCNQSFVSKSAMISHLESGACPSGADRRMINRWVRLNDPHNVVTVPGRLITGGDEPTYIATDRSWNGVAYECVLCHNTFATLDALNRHLASPRHQDKSFRCPLSTCAKTFNTLSGLCRHVESESCGILRFKAVREGMDELFSKMRRIRGEREAVRLHGSEYENKVRCVLKVRDSFPMEPNPKLVGGAYL